MSAVMWGKFYNFGNLYLYDMGVILLKNITVRNTVSDLLI